MILLGAIGELEIGGEGADQVDGAFGVEPPQLTEQALFQLRIELLSELLAGKPYIFFQVEELLAALGFEGASEEVAEQPNVVS